MLMGLMLTGALYSAFAPANAEKESTTDQAQIEQGRELFLVGCSFCHGQNGEGINSQTGQYGPSLVGVGAAAVDFQMGTGRMPMSQPGQQAAVKDKLYTDEEIEAIAAYVASLGPGPSVPTEDEYSIDAEVDELVDGGMSEEDARNSIIVRGGQLFLANCSACHNFEGSGGAMPWGKVAPSLQKTSDRHIYEAMLTGPQQMDVFSNGNIAPRDKAAIIAYLNSIEENPGYGGFSLGGLGPVSEGAAAWILGIGGLVGFAYWIAAHSTRSEKTEEKKA